MAITTITRDGTDQTAALNTALADTNDLRLAGGRIEFSTALTHTTCPKVYSEDGSGVFMRDNSDLAVPWNISKAGMSMLDCHHDFNGTNQDSTGNPQREGLYWTGDNGTCTDCYISNAGDPVNNASTNQSNIRARGANFTCTDLVSSGAGYAAIQNECATKGTYRNLTLRDYGYKGFNQGTTGGDCELVTVDNVTCSTIYDAIHIQLDCSPTAGTELVRAIVTNVTILSNPISQSVMKFAALHNCTVRNVTMDKSYYTANHDYGIIFAEDVGRITIRNCQVPGRITQFPSPDRDEGTDHDFTTLANVASVSIDDCEIASADFPIWSTWDSMQAVQAAMRRCTLHTTSSGALSRRWFTHATDESRFVSFCARDNTLYTYHTAGNTCNVMEAASANTTTVSHTGSGILTFPNDHDIRWAGRNNTLVSVNGGATGLSSNSNLTTELEDTTH